MKSFIKKMVTPALLLTAVVIQVNAQSIITGKVVNKKDEPIVAATIGIKGSGAGVKADSLGNFRLSTAEKGKQLLQVSSVGYAAKETGIFIMDSVLHLRIVLKDEAKAMGEVVVISAGAFEASDKAKGASLTPMDAVTVAGNGGDIANALRSLPGAQQIGEKEGLYVRGGTGEETRQFVDGLLLKQPNFSSIPGLPQPARLNPFLFRGILFSSGGYSALYGQALSSALILETIDLPEESSIGLHLFPQSVGVGLQQLAKNKKSSYGINTSYGNLKAYHSVITQKPDFFHGPETFSADANFRVKTSKTGMLKFYTNYGYSHTGMRNPDIDSSDLLSLYELKGRNWYNNLSYRESLGKQWKIDAAIGYNYYKDAVNTALQNSDKENISLPGYPFAEKNTFTHNKSNFAQGRLVLTKRWRYKQALRFGAEYFYSKDSYLFNDSAALLKDNITAAFAEADIRLTHSIAARAGLRAEHSALLNQTTLAPRISLAYRLGKGAQFNMAYGIFYQKPENNYLQYPGETHFTRATHYIINFQKKAGNRLLRVEAYYKKYNDLITTVPHIKNDGDGYARGIELFWRDKKTFKGFDYWVSYTYLDTKRRYLDYPYALRPNFTTPHSAFVAIKKFFPDISFNANLSYTIATGRPYYNIQTSDGVSVIHDQGRTNTYNAMNLSFAYLFSIFPKWKHRDFSGIGFGINNVFGSRQIFGYRYSYNGVNKTSITQPAARSFYIGLFMSFGVDRTEDFIDQNL